MTHEAARTHDAGIDAKLAHGLCSIVKLYASEMAGRVADRAAHPFGGRGYMRENAAERFYPELRVERICEGASEVQRVIVAGQLVKRGPRSLVGGQGLVGGVVARLGWSPSRLGLPVLFPALMHGASRHEGHPSAEERLVLEEVEVSPAVLCRVVHRAGRFATPLVRTGEPRGKSSAISSTPSSLLNSTDVTRHGGASPWAAPNVSNRSESSTSSLSSSAAPTVCRKQVKACQKSVGLPAWGGPGDRGPEGRGPPRCTRAPGS